MINQSMNKQEGVVDLLHFDSNEAQQQVTVTRKKLKTSSTTSSPQYRCPCQKQYYSYAAAYTHVRNKHGGSRQYLNAIQRPNFQKTKKGRPRKYNQIIVDDQFYRINVIDCCIEQIFQKIQKYTKDRLILQPKEQYQSLRVAQQYKKLKGQKIVPLVNILETQQDCFSKPILSELKRFYDEITKQFTPQLNSRILATINYMYQQRIQKSESIFQFQPSQSIFKQNMQKIWYNNQRGMQIYSMINQKFNQWAQYCKRESDKLKQQDRQGQKAIFLNYKPHVD